MILTMILAILSNDYCLWFPKLGISQGFINLIGIEELAGRPLRGNGGARSDRRDIYMREHQE